MEVDSHTKYEINICNSLEKKVRKTDAGLTDGRTDVRTDGRSANLKSPSAIAGRGLIKIQYFSFCRV